MIHLKQLVCATVLIVASCATSELKDQAKALLDERPQVTFTGAEPSSGWLPITHEHKPVVRGQAGDQTVSVLLDTGAGVTVVDRSIAERLGLETAGFGSARGAGGKVAKMQIARGFALQLGNLRLSEIPAIVIDLSPVRRNNQGPPPVILGSQIFHSLVTELDYPNRRLALRQESAMSPPTGAVAVPLQFLSDSRVAIDVGVEGHEPRAFLLDTGADAEIDLFASAAAELEVLDGRPAHTHAIGGVGGRVEAQHITLRSVLLGGQKFSKVDCSVFPANDSNMSENGLHGLVGSGILARFRVILDYRTRRAYFVRTD